MSTRKIIARHPAGATRRFSLIEKTTNQQQDASVTAEED